LADRRDSDRLLPEEGVRFGGVPRQLMADSVSHCPEWDRRRRVLQRRQRLLVGGRDEIWTRRKDLAELDERRAELQEGVAEVLGAASGRLSLMDAKEPLAREVGESRHRVVHEDRADLYSAPVHRARHLADRRARSGRVTGDGDKAAGRALCGGLCGRPVLCYEDCEGR